MKREARAYLHDVIEACDRIARFTSGKSYAEYLAEEMFRSAVERQLGIIGEAVAQIRTREPALLDEITDASSIIAFHNILIHSYETVADETVWGILRSHLPQLRQDAEHLLADAEAGTSADGLDAETDEDPEEAQGDNGSSAGPERQD